MPLSKWYYSTILDAEWGAWGHFPSQSTLWVSVSAIVAAFGLAQPWHGASGAGEWKGGVVAVKVIAHDASLSRRVDTLRESLVGISMQHPCVVRPCPLGLLQFINQAGHNSYRQLIPPVSMQYCRQLSHKAS